MKDYSQNGEQAIITRYFTGRKRGTLLDCGANDGETFSMSRALMLDGWEGVLVEPSAAAFEKLQMNYVEISSGMLPYGFSGPPSGFMDLIASKLDVKISDRVKLVNAAITPTDGPVDFYDSGTHLKKGDVALLSTTRPEEMDRWKKSGEQFTKTQVRGITFETLMKETGVTQFQFISIDCEGADIDVLTQIDLRAVGCEMLCIEYNQNKVAEQIMSVYCARHGMKLHAKTYENLIFSR